MSHVIGIDPGKLGGIAMVGNGQWQVYASKMPDHEHDVIDLILKYKELGGGSVYLEQVSSSPQMGVVSAFTFGRMYGMLRACVIACRLPLHEVRPFIWQRALGCLTKGDKNVSKRKAQDLFPTFSITHATADALLIAEYGRRLKEGLLLPSQ